MSEAQHIPSGGQSMEEMSFVDSINNAENCGFDSGMIWAHFSSPLSAYVCP